MRMEFNKKDKTGGHSVGGAQSHETTLLYESTKEVSGHRGTEDWLLGHTHCNRREMDKGTGKDQPVRYERNQSRVVPRSKEKDVFQEGRTAEHQEDN